jgi:hypothetical protein
MLRLQGLRNAQENNVPIAIFSIGALLRECTLQRSTLLVTYLDARPLAEQIIAAGQQLFDAPG